MQKHIKKYLPLFLLFLLLFPVVEKQVHSFEHLKDVHCSATDKHFHELEHSCSICDYTITDSNSTPETAVLFIISTKTISFHPFIESIYTPDAFQNLPPRAPPVLLS